MIKDDILKWIYRNPSLETMEFEDEEIIKLIPRTDSYQSGRALYLEIWWKACASVLSRLAMRVLCPAPVETRTKLESHIAPAGIVPLGIVEIMRDLVEMVGLTKSELVENERSSEQGKTIMDTLEKGDPNLKTWRKAVRRELGNVSGETLKENVSDVKTWGEPNDWKLICKAWSDEQGWMRSTRAMEIPGMGCLVQVSTIETNAAGLVLAVAEAITFVPGVRITGEAMADGECVMRELRSMYANESSG